jgi:phage shock protein PspC (stress-responsive transcriptional regulator)
MSIETSIGQVGGLLNKGKMPNKNTKTTTKKLIRPLEGRKIAGVAAAFANYFGIDVTLIRILLALTLVPGGVPGLLIYVICWLLIPTEEE